MHTSKGRSICISFYEEANNIIFVSFNGEQTRIYDNGKLQIIDAAMQAAFQNEDLFPKRGQELRYLVNGKERVARGEPGEAAVITLNGKSADIHSKIHANDIIEVKPSTRMISITVNYPNFLVMLNLALIVRKN